MSSTGAIEPARDEARGRTFPCEQCGADLVFHIGAQSLRCEYCGHTKELSVSPEVVSERDLAAHLEAIAERRTTPGLDAQRVHCGACGANTLFTGTLSAQECSYCGAPLQRADAHAASTQRVSVDAMLPFRVEAASAKENLRRWVGSRWFAPNDFKQRAVFGKMNGVFLPFYTFDAMTATSYRGARGDHYTVTVGSGNNRRTETRTRWTPASGRFEHFFDDVLVPAFATLPANLLVALEPWPLTECKPFNSELLAGSVAHTYDVEPKEGLSHAKERMHDALDRNVRARIGGDVQRVDEVYTSYSALTFKHLLLPVWLMAYRYGERSYRVAVNACTGEVVGERPYSVWKILFAVLVGLVAVAVVLEQSG